MINSHIIECIKKVHFRHDKQEYKSLWYNILASSNNFSFSSCSSAVKGSPTSDKPQNFSGNVAITRSFQNVFFQEAPTYLQVLPHLLYPLLDSFDVFAENKGNELCCNQHKKT